ncbi:MAG: hypothetical protein KOO62_05265 [candidate division Zixibacteria bacterium]|nr:hypothetical protein [candidate division Zixibacteria bacterium]
MRILSETTGHTIIELLAALFITGIMTAAGYNFYIKMHNQSIAQSDISDLQQNSRNTIQEITKTLRSAGYKVGTHVPYRIGNDSLLIFFSDTNPVDSVLYYLEDYNGDEAFEVAQLPVGLRPKKLMKRVNSNPPEMYSGLVQSISYVASSASLIQVTLVVQTGRPDEDFNSNDGVRTLTSVESVTLRNVTL